ncbi:hypothetical protein HY468_04370 [Candidatus Roizmanbacteria bacterium]|nr:hypothetical protein [Candidatus Roizmanbacteria bacterium]
MYNLVFIVFLIRSARTILYHLFWWERKEYRVDRMLVHLRETRQGKRWLLSILSIIKWIVLVGMIILLEGQEQIPNEYEKSLVYVGIGFFATTIGLYLFEGVRDVLALRSGWKKPPPRIRVVVIGLFVGAIVLLLLLSRFYYFPVHFLLIDKFIGPLIAFLIILSNRLFEIHKKRKIRLAREKIARYPNLVVVGITGSYGKTTTKELTAQLLASAYKTVKTFASQNSDIGIAERVLKANLTGADFFVCEMAAYHPGEIASSCSIFGNKISVAIITGINEQHQSLFGSLDTTRRSKYELIEALGDGGVALFNAASDQSKQMIEWAKKQRRFTTRVINTTSIKHLPASIHALHFKQNLAFAIAAVKACGMSDTAIKKALDTLQLPEKTMHETVRRGVTIIDDTFNANPDAVYAALEHIKTFKGTKILVLQPLIELGSFADSVHEKIGELATTICDEVVLANKNWYKAFMQGAARVSGGLTKVKVGKPPSLIKRGVILFEGKEADVWMKGYEEREEE